MPAAAPAQHVPAPIVAVAVAAASNDNQRACPTGRLVASTTQQTRKMKPILRKVSMNIKSPLFLPAYMALILLAASSQQGQSNNAITLMKAGKATSFKTYLQPILNLSIFTNK